MKLLRAILLYPFTPAKRRAGLQETLVFCVVFTLLWLGVMRLFTGPLTRGNVVLAVIGIGVAAAFGAWRDRNAPR